MAKLRGKKTNGCIGGADLTTWGIDKHPTQLCFSCWPPLLTRSPLELRCFQHLRRHWRILGLNLIPSLLPLVFFLSFNKTLINKNKIPSFPKIIISLPFREIGQTSSLCNRIIIFICFKHIQCKTAKYQNGDRGQNATTNAVPAAKNVRELSRWNPVVAVIDS